MRNLCSRYTVALGLSLVAGIARASGDSGTSAMGEMNVTGGQLAMMAGGLVGLGVVFWLVAKFMK